MHEVKLQLLKTLLKQHGIAYRDLGFSKSYVYMMLAGLRPLTPELEDRILFLCQKKHAQRIP